jgi:anti-sigma factor RsiW
MPRLKWKSPRWKPKKRLRPAPSFDHCDVRQADLVASNRADEGYQLLGGRILPARDRDQRRSSCTKPRIGGRVTLSIKQDTAGRKASFCFTEHDGLSAFRWKHGPLVYVLKDTAPREELLGLAHASRALFAN